MNPYFLTTGIILKSGIRAVLANTALKITFAVLLTNLIF